MIIPVELTINGRLFIKQYSDLGYKLERDGARYADAIDPVEFDRKYTETDEPIEPIEPETDEATEQDYLNALNELGVQTDEEVDA